MTDNQTEIKENGTKITEPTPEAPKEGVVETKKEVDVKVPVETKTQEANKETKIKERRESPHSWLQDLDGIYHDFRHGLLDWFWNPDSDVLVPSFSFTATPSLDIEETEKEYKIHAELPGLGKEDVKVELDGHTLTISGEKKEETEEKKGKVFLRKERRYESYSRTLELPDDALTTEDIDATLENGVLQIAVKRKAPEPRKEVKIR